MMSNLNYRYFQTGDEKEIVELWNQTLKKDPITTKRFRNLVLLDANFDPKGLRLAFAENRLVGCVYSVRRQLPMYGTDLEPENGWIPFFFVDKGYSQKGIATKLMDEAIEFLS